MKDLIRNNAKKVSSLISAMIYSFHRPVKALEMFVDAVATSIHKNNK